MKPPTIPSSKPKIFLNTVLWGLFLWVVGYILGMIFFAIVPKGMIGWAVTPFGIAVTLWVLISRIRRSAFTCYFGLGLIWTVLAVALDYLCIVRLFHVVDYYKPDVYLYYALTFLLPLAVGWYRFKRVPKKA